MRESVKSIFARCLVALALAGGLVLANDRTPGMAAGGDLTGVAAVVDGDTIALGQTRIRLEGIDAPEAAQRCGRNWLGRLELGTWACGERAASRLAEIIAGRPVACTSHGNDRYGRLLATCYRDGVDINAEMVRQGFAWAFVKYSSRYVEIERQAREKRVGVWQGENEAPWLYRERRWQTAETDAPGGCAIKGNVARGERVYHMPWSPWYTKTRVEPAKGERWFCDEAEATAAGFRPAVVR